MVDSTTAVQMKCVVHPKYTDHKPNIYIIWYIKFDRVLEKNGKGKYQHNFRDFKYIVLKGPICTIILTFMIFRLCFNYDIYVASDSTNIKIKAECLSVPFSMTPCLAITQ